MVDDSPRSRRQLNWTTIALVGGFVLLLLMIAYFATGRDADQDKLTSPEVTETQPPSSEKTCSTQATYDLVKGELFRRAAQLRGSDQAAYDQLARVAVLRMENAVMESEEGATGAVNCSGSLSLDLPPGVTAAGGRHTLTADIDYTIGGDGGAELRNADSMISQLATLSRTSPPSSQPVAPTETNEVEPATGEHVAAAESTKKPTGPVSIYPGRPSFDCGKARSKGEITVCSDTGLSELDRNMASQFRRALTVASPPQEALLRQTAKRFLAYRDRCPDTHCAAEAYLGRMREIRDIMEGRLQVAP